jgi:flagellar hook-length control protein FliK
MTEISTALLEPAPAPAPSGKEPPGSPPDTPFAAVLDDHQARTAVAEGHRRADEAPADDAERKPSPDAGAVAALLGGVPLPTGTAVAVAPVAAAGAAEPEPLGGRVLSPGEASREQARGIVLPRATRPIGVPADAAALPLRPVSAGAAATATAPSPSLPVGLDVAAAEGSGDGLGAAAAVAPAIARATRLADVLQAVARPGAAAPATSATPAPATVAGAAGGRAQSDAAGGQPGQAATPATPATPTVAPATPATPSATAQASAPAETTVPGRGVGLDHAVETVRLALRHGAERGVTHARISLTPRELGSIEVHLRQTADGLVARVVAEHGAAAQQLQQAGAELRRSLEQQGVNVLQLDIGASGEEAADRRGAAFDAAGFGQDRGGRRGDVDPDALSALDAAADADVAQSTTTLQLPNGALVDVLA